MFKTHSTGKAGSHSHFNRMAVRLAAAGCAALVLALPVGAQTSTPAVPAGAATAPAAEVTMTGIEIWDSAGCFGCHGDLASGGGDAANPGAPSLRRRLSHEVLVNAISCGRPNADMPAFLIGAYTEVACGDAPVGSVPTNVISMEQLTAAEIDTLVAWLEENVVGKNRITRENCALFFGGNMDAPTCMQF